MSKQDFINNLKIVNENADLLKDSNGFDILGQKMGINKDKLKKNTSFEFVKEEKLNYFEKKHL